MGFEIDASVLILVGMWTFIIFDATWCIRTGNRKRKQRLARKKMMDGICRSIRGG